MNISDEKIKVITIDGPAGSGKTTLARNLSCVLGYPYLNTGLTYRALALKVLIEEVDFNNETEVFHVASQLKDFIKLVPGNKNEFEVYLDSININDRLKSDEISTVASIVSQYPEVREAMVDLQRWLAAWLCLGNSSVRAKGIIVEGRDAGTIIFPQADVKIFLTATLEERAKRRLNDFKGLQISLNDIKAKIQERDHRDMTRVTGQLKPAIDAIAIDNSTWSEQQTLENTLEIIRRLLP